MKRYFLFRILVVILYIGVLWYGLRTRTNVGYMVIAVGMIAGLLINFWNYQVNYKANFAQQQNQEQKKPGVKEGDD